MSTKQKIFMFSGSSNHKLAEGIAKELNINLNNAIISKFADQELNIEIDITDVENNKITSANEIFIIQSLSNPVNDHIIELLLIVDAVKRELSSKITVIIPYFGYARQDRVIKRVNKNRNFSSALSAKVIANMLESAKISKLITVDMHSVQHEGFFNMPVHQISFYNIFIDFAKKQKCIVNSLKDLAIVAPDIGALHRARAFSQLLSQEMNISPQIEVAVIEKIREKAGISEVMRVIGNIQNKHCIIVDDIVDSGGTLCNAAAALKKNGAKYVDSYITHGVLSGVAIEKISTSEIDSLVITDTIDHKDRLKNTNKIKVLPIAPYLSNIIRKQTKIK